ncbi:Inner membrane protein YohK [compost metagenome]
MIAATVRHPLFAIALTLLAYRAALFAQQRSRLPIAQPVLLATALVVAALLACGVDYASYQRDAAPLWLLLGPATVALAVPLQANLKRIRRLFWPVLIALGVGGSATVGTALLLAGLLGATPALSMSLAPKSVTSPIAILLAEQLGGIAALTAVFVMLTGVLGVVLGPWLLRLAGVDAPAARGLAFGLNAHAIGTAHALEEGEECAAFAALAMSLAGAATAVLLPLVL